MTAFEAWSNAKNGDRVRRAGWRNEPDRFLVKGDPEACINPAELMLPDWEIVAQEEAPEQ